MEVSRRVTPISIKFNVKWDLLLKNSVSTYLLLDDKFPCITKGNIRAFIYRANFPELHARIKQTYRA